MLARPALIAFILVAVLNPVEATAQSTDARTIDMYSFGFTPRPIHLAAGRPVTLTFVNRSGHGHDFTAAKFFAASRIVAGSAPGGEIDVGAHQARSLTLVPSAGRYRAHCGHFLHKQMGMNAVVIVD